MSERSPKNYFETLQRNFPIAPGSDPKKFKKTLEMLASTERSKKALSALGAEEKPSGGPGVFQRLFDQREGILLAPARFGSALVLDVLGYDDPNLNVRNPLQSAIDSARGEFAITGGDVIKVNDNDSLIERLGKYAAAFTFDVATDPITFIGPVATFSKKAAAVSAVRNGENILSSAVRVIGEGGGASDTLIDDLFRRSRLFNAADVQRRFSEAGINIADNTPMSLLGMNTNGVVSDSIKRRVASSTIGLIVGESLLVGGRVKLRKDLTTLLGSEAAARKLFRELPDQIAGGTFLKTPTGRVVTRISGGTGGPSGVLGDLAQSLSRGRFAVSATVGLPVSKYLSGESGPVFAAVKRGIFKGLPDSDRTTLLDYVSYRKAVSEKKLFEQDFGLRTGMVMSSVLASRKALGSEVEGQQFDSFLKTYYSQPNLRPSVKAGVAEMEAHSRANDLRETINQVASELRAAGIDIGDLGDDFVPLILTETEAGRILLEEYRGIGLAKDASRYSPSKTRQAYTSVIPDPEERKRVGFNVPNLENLVFLNAASINKMLGREAFETDPLTIASKYLDYASSQLSARRFNQVAYQTGTIVNLPAESKKVYNAIAAASFMAEATEKATPAARKKAQQMLDRTKDELRYTMSEPYLRMVQKNMVEFQGAALRKYDETKASAASIRRALSAADKELADATQQYEVVLRQQTAENLSQYAQTNIDRAVSEWERLRNNASSRLSRARRSSDEAMQELEVLANTDLGSDAARAARVRAEKVADESVSVQDARNQLDEAKLYRDQVIPTFVERQMGQQRAAWSRYENAVAARVRLVEQFDVARSARTESQAAYKASLRNTTISRLKAIDSIVDTYVIAKVRFDSAALTIGSKGLAAASPAVAAEYRTAKRAFTEARKMMFETLGHSKSFQAQGKRKFNPGVEYAELIVDLAMRLSDEELIAARVFANADSMDDIVRSLYGATNETMMQAIGDMMETYRGIRKFLEPEDLRKLDSAERRLVSLDPKSGAATFDYVVEGNILDMRPEDLVKDARAEVSAAGRSMYTDEKGFRQIGASKRGATVVLPRALEDTWAPNGVADVLESFYKARQFPDDWEKHVRGIYDPLNMVWKSSATVGRGPAYVMLNTVGGLAANFYARVSLKSHRIAAIMVSESSQALVRVRKQHPNKGYLELVPLIEAELKRKLGSVKVNGVNVVDLFAEFLYRGGHFSTDISYNFSELTSRGLGVEEPLSRLRGRFIKTQDTLDEAPEVIKDVANLLLTNPYQAAMTDAAQASELFIRFSAFVDGWEKFKNFDDAFDLTSMLHFDYQDLSSMEIWLKRFIPFYTWSRNNVPFQMRAAFTSTDQFSKIIKANANLEAAFSADDEWLNEYLPDYIVESGGFISSLKFRGNHLALFNKLPFSDVDKLLQVVYVGSIPVVVPRSSELVNVTGPTVKTPIELLTQRSFQYGREYDTFYDSLTAQGKQLVPQWMLVKRTLSAAGLPVEQERQVSNLFQLLIGAPYGMTTFTEDTLRGTAMSRNIKLNKQIRAAAAEANVDVEWLRKEVSSGTPPAVLAAKVAMGLGDVKRLELQKRLQGRDLTIGTYDYDAMLRRFESSR